MLKYLPILFRQFGFFLRFILSSYNIILFVKSGEGVSVPVRRILGLTSNFDRWVQRLTGRVGLRTGLALNESRLFVTL